MDKFLPYKLKQKVTAWREEKYACEYPAISEIFDWNLAEDVTGIKRLRYLRRPQFEALEVYWYLRLVEKTPKIMELYRRLYPEKPDLLQALGLDRLDQKDTIKLLNGGMFEVIQKDDDFIRRNKLDGLRETATLAYPSYILALAMGAGKTVLIGSIIATEFTMALEYPDVDFIQNALVFAPGKTILGALKEISDTPYSDILPPRLYKQFISSVKFTYTQDKEKDIPIIKGSLFNIVITNTEKIRIQKPTSRNGSQLNFLKYKSQEKQQEAEETANLRLRTIASLPHLGIFSDEAHHTYGKSLDAELKKVRKTVDYLAENTNVIAVVNTTGTPYFKKTMLRDVVNWYGLSQGIKDGILKEVKDSIKSYQDIDDENYIKHVVKDFFKEYGDLELYDGSKAKIAIYFPQTDDVVRLKPIVQETLAEIGYDPNIVLEVNNKSPEDIKDLFNNRVNEPNNPYRVFLLVNMGTEGWNCPSLFSTSLARKLTSSNNFVLQAACRCLRQVPNNTRKARIYLSKHNVGILDAQLMETFGESLKMLNNSSQDVVNDRIILRKIELPKLVINKKIERVVPKETNPEDLTFVKPLTTDKKAKVVTYEAQDPKARFHVLSPKDETEIEIEEDTYDLFQASVELTSIYRLDTFFIYEKLKALYPEGDIPKSDFDEFRRQIEDKKAGYDKIEETVEIALALVKKEGFRLEEKDGQTAYVAEIMYHKSKADLLLKYEQLKDSNGRDFSFHYTPYNFDSKPEREFFLEMLDALNENPDDVADIFFTGALTDRNKTDFIFEYKDKNGVWRCYTPDFVIRKKDGRILIVEIKADVYRDVNKEMALREIEGLNHDKLRYEILMADAQRLNFGETGKAKTWIYGENR